MKIGNGASVLEFSSWTFTAFWHPRVSMQYILKWTLQLISKKASMFMACQFGQASMPDEAPGWGSPIRWIGLTVYYFPWMSNKNVEYYCFELKQTKAFYLNWYKNGNHINLTIMHWEKKWSQDGGVSWCVTQLHLWHYFGTTFKDILVVTLVEHQP